MTIEAETVKEPGKDQTSHEWQKMSFDGWVKSKDPSKAEAKATGGMAGRHQYCLPTCPEF